MGGCERPLLGLFLLPRHEDPHTGWSKNALSRRRLKGPAGDDPSYANPRVPSRNKVLRYRVVALEPQLLLHRRR